MSRFENVDSCPKAEAFKLWLAREDYDTKEYKKLKSLNKENL